MSKTIRSLDALRAAGLVRRASERTDEGVEGSLPVAAALRPLLPGGCLRRGGTIAVGGARGSGGARGGTSAVAGAAGRGSAVGGACAGGSAVAGAVGGRGVVGGSAVGGGSGSTSLLFTLLAEASAAGSWCAVVGLPQLGLVAAAQAGVAVQRLALVPHPGPDWVDVVGALLDGLDIVVVATASGVTPQLAARVGASARQRGAVLVALGAWPGADVTLDVVREAWHGLGQGVGRLRRREVEILAGGRGAAARPRRVRLWLPGARPEVAEPPGVVRPGVAEWPEVAELPGVARPVVTELERRLAS